MREKVRSKISAWYEGRFVPHANDPNSGVVFMGGSHHHHWTATVARKLVGFWLEHWKWIIGLVVALAALIVRARR
jgi:hypothetical protein